MGMGAEQSINQQPPASSAPSLGPRLRRHFAGQLKELETAYQITQERIKELDTVYRHLSKREEALNDLFVFARDVLGFRELYEPLHRPLCETISDDRILRRLILLPRGHFKTTVISIAYPLWVLCRNQDARIALCSKAAGKAEENLEEIIQRAQRDEFQDLFGDIVGHPSKWPVCRKDKVRIPRKGSTTGPSIAAYSIESSEVGRHFDKMILDDIVDAENVNSVTSRDNTWSWFGRQLSVLDPGSVMTVVGTRWHFDDVYSRILSELPRHDGTNPVGWWVERRAAIEDGKLLFPGRFTREILDEIRRVQGDYIYSCFYLNDPVGEGMNPFSSRRMAWIDYVRPEDRKRDPAARRHMISWPYLLVDPAATKKEYSCYSGIILGDALSDSTFVVRQAWLDKLHPDQLIDRLSELALEHDVKTVVIEDEAYQKSLYYWLKRDKMLNGWNFRVEKIANPRNVSQEMRLLALQPFINNQAVKFDKAMGGRKPMVEEIDMYPRGPHKDLLCALYFATQIQYPPYEYVDEEPEPPPRHLQFINELIHARRCASRTPRLSVGGVR